LGLKKNELLFKKYPGKTHEMMGESSNLNMDFAGNYLCW
jgi:hypothetical protein